MQNHFPSSTRRRFLATSATVGALGLGPSVSADGFDAVIDQPGGGGSTDPAALRPFRASVSDAALADLQRRLAMTRLPEKETVADDSQGVPLKTVQQLLQYWQAGYDWRKVEARLNTLRSSSPRSMGSTSTSFTCAQSTPRPCR